MRRVLVLFLWRLLAGTAVLLGFIGIFVPGLPTVPFLLLAAWAAGRGWPALEVWLLKHPRWGGSIRAWRERGRVPRRAKWTASLMMGLSAALMYLAGAPRLLTLGVALLMLGVAVWLWRRPET